MDSDQQTRPGAGRSHRIRRKPNRGRSEEARAADQYAFFAVRKKAEFAHQPRRRPTRWRPAGHEEPVSKRLPEGNQRVRAGNRTSVLANS